MSEEIWVTPSEAKEISALRRKHRSGKSVDYYEKCWEIFQKRFADVLEKLGMPEKERIIEGGWHRYVWRE